MSEERAKNAAELLTRTLRQRRHNEFMIVLHRAGDGGGRGCWWVGGLVGSGLLRRLLPQAVRALRLFGVLGALGHKDENRDLGSE